MLGGLIRTRRANTRTGIPYLSKIPILGFLFGVTVDHVDRTELLLLITPRVVGDPSEAQDLLQQLRKQRPDLEKSLRTQPSIVRPDPGTGSPTFLPPPPPRPAPREPTAPLSPGGGSDGR